MPITINYGTKKLLLNLPPSLTFDDCNSRIMGTELNRREFLQALTSAESRLFSVEKADLFVVNDAYRPTPTARIVKWLNQAGRINQSARILIATGCHQAPNDSQLKEILGTLCSEMQHRVLVHNADSSDDMIELGETPDGEKVQINRHFRRAQNPVVIGSVEPHYFAGFTGGRKSIFPGLCDYETTARNHRLAANFTAAPLKLEGNPVEEHLQSLMRFVSSKNIFGIQLVCGQEQKIQAIFCGELDKAFRQAVSFSRRVYAVEAKRKYDLILAEVRPPLDSNLYQLQKSLENCQTAVVDGGTIILFSRCHEGIGQDSFYKLAERWHKGDKLESELKSDFGVHKLSRVYEIGRRINVFLYSELAAGVPDKVFYRHTDNPQSIIDEIIKEKEEIFLAVVRDAGNTVLTI